MTPYTNLSPKAFWKLAVSSKNLFDVGELWDPKFDIQPSDGVATYGSCFAQHIGHNLRKRGFNWLNTEAPPACLSEDNARLFNYNIFSARTGNIYTTSLLAQWTQWALDENTVPDEVWEKDGRYFDPFRPRIEPDGFQSSEELLSSRQQAIQSFKKSILISRYFVFTLGLTESWVNGNHRYEYPMFPGTAAGTYDPKLHIFRNQTFSEVIKNLKISMKLMRTINSGLRFILTVSPIPLTATQSGKHILVATIESKSILRAVAGELSNSLRFVDYFPSYEIITSPVFKGVFFEANNRSICSHGVSFVMDEFFNALVAKYGVDDHKKITPSANLDLICEEELLDSIRQR